jgi:hypothetical protein
MGQRFRYIAAAERAESSGSVGNFLGGGHGDGNGKWLIIGGASR